MPWFTKPDKHGPCYYEMNQKPFFISGRKKMFKFAEIP